MSEFQKNNKFDLEERTSKFGEKIIILCKTIKYGSIGNSLVSQVIRSATSVGANYMEASGASSKKDFRNKIFICRKEANETKHWLRMLASHAPEKKQEIRNLWKEAQELTLIFSKITRSLDKKH